MRTIMFLIVTIGGLAAGYHWCFGKGISYGSVASARPRYSPMPYSTTSRTEKKGNYIITTTTHWGQKPAAD
jgi:hypothetical protein